MFNLAEGSTRKKLLENFTSLSLLQLLNYIFPLITLPYLVRTIGPEKYGLTAFAFAFVNYFTILVDYGFNLSATRRVAILKNEKETLSKLFHSVLFIKLGFSVVGLIVFSLIISNFDRFSYSKAIYYFTFLFVPASMLFPVFFFQGIEKMKIITVLNFLSKIIYTVLLFAFITKVDDYLYVPLFSACANLVTGILSLFIIYLQYKLPFSIPSAIEILVELKEGWYTFLSVVFISVYTVSNIFILGLFASDLFVAYYSAGEKLIGAFKGIYSSVGQTVYPHVSALVQKSDSETKRFLTRLLRIVGMLSLLGSIFIFIFADFFIKVIFGAAFLESVIVIKLLAATVFFISLSNIFGIVVMLNFNYKMQFLKIIAFVSIIHILLSFLLVPQYLHIGTSVSVLITEILVTSLMWLFIRKKIPTLTKSFLPFYKEKCDD